MPSVNKVILIGNLTRDPQTKQLPSQSLVTEFGLAMNRKFKSPEGEDREEVCFVDCAAFGRQAEVIQKYCKKGKSLYIEGRLRYDSWEDKNGHGKRSKLSVVVDNFQFLGGREDQPAAGVPAGGGARDERGVPRGNWEGANLPERAARGKPQQPFGEQTQFKEADIPF
ncbi:MAG: single-stranded DNA-binding protein [Phycisphaerales bacterium]|nr:single-stranded DNA-binding protein [Phycisphaerales bacterium]